MENLPPGVHLVERLDVFPGDLPRPDPAFVFNTSVPTASYSRVAHWATDLLSVRARCEGKERPIFPIFIVGSGQETAVRALAETLPPGVEIWTFSGSQVFGDHARDGTPTTRSAFFLIAR